MFMRVNTKSVYRKDLEHSLTNHCSPTSLEQQDVSTYTQPWPRATQFGQLLCCDCRLLATVILHILSVTLTFWHSWLCLIVLISDLWSLALSSLFLCLCFLTASQFIHLPLNWLLWLQTWVLLDVRFLKPIAPFNAFAIHSKKSVHGLFCKST